MSSMNRSQTQLRHWHIWIWLSSIIDESGSAQSCHWYIRIWLGDVNAASKSYSEVSKFCSDHNIASLTTRCQKQKWSSIANTMANSLLFENIHILRDVSLKSRRSKYRENIPFSKRVSSALIQRSRFSRLPKLQNRKLKTVYRKGKSSKYIQRTWSDAGLC